MMLMKGLESRIWKVKTAHQCALYNLFIHPSILIAIGGCGIFPEHLCADGLTPILAEL